MTVFSLHCPIMMTGVAGIAFFFFFVFILYGNSEAVRLRCDNQGYREGTGYNIYCDTVDASTSNVSWSLVSNTGETTNLGWCDGSGSCRSLQSGITLQRSSITYSSIYISPIKQEMAGTVICTETHEGRIHTDNCTLRVVSIALQSCGENGYEIREGYNRSISCYVSTSYSANAITWTLQNPTGLTTYLGTCYSTNNCTSPLDPYIRLERISTTSSYLRITGMKRETGGNLVCSDGHEVSSCTLDVQTTNTVYGDCSLEVYRHNWTAVGSCEVTKTYSALGKIGYRVYQTWTGPSFVSSSHYLFAGRRHVTPTVFTDSTDGKVYYRVNITYSWPLPKQDGSYVYTVYTYPAGKGKQLPNRIFIENPTAPTHNCTDLNYLPESGRVPCVCSTSSLGSPAGRLIWFSGDTVLAAGQYGVTSLQFPSNVTDDECDVMQMTCQLDWILKQNVSFPVLCKAREIIDTDEQNSPDTSSTDRVWAITVTAVLGLIVVVLVIVLLMRRHCSSPHQQPQLQPPQPQDPSHTYDALNMGHVTGREGETGPSNAISPAGRDTIYQNAGV